MAPRSLVHSRSNTTLLGHAAAFLAEAPAHSEILVVAPTRAAANELAARAFSSGCQGVHALTLTQLAGHLATKTMGRLALAPISRLGIEAFAARIVHAAATAKHLPYFGPVAQTPGFARALAKTITELRLENIDPRALSDTGPAGRDLSHLLDLYEGELEQRSVADFPLLLRLAAQEAESIPSAHRFTRLPLVLLGLAIESASHERLLAALIERSPSVLATATTGDDAIESLERILGATRESLDNDPPSRTLDRVRTWLFSPDQPPAAPPDPTLLFSAPGESFECVEIARRIHVLAARGTPFDRIAILLRNVDTYQPLVEEALRRAGIGHYFSRGAARPDPAGRAFLALLACAGENCSASRFAEYLSLGQTPPLDADGSPLSRPRQWIPTDDEILAAFQTPTPDPAPLEEDHGGPPLDVPIGWEKLLVDAAVIGGRARWARRLRGLSAELQAQLRALDSEGDSLQAYIQRRIQQLKRLEHFALPLIDALGALPLHEKWGGWLDRLADLAQMALRHPESVLSVLGELDPMREVGPVSLDEVHDVLSERLGFLRADPPQRRFGRVFVGSIEEARGRSFEIVFLPGLAEGLFPRRAVEDPLLLDEHRVQFASGLSTQKVRVADERMLLRSAAAAASESIVFSYPRMDVAQARARVPSFYALEVVRAAEGRLPSLREFEKRAARAASSRLDWPAPANPREAIDDAEYDLASLQTSLKLRGAAATGSARYLIETNQSLARSLRTRGRRWRARWSDADGIVHPDSGTLAALDKHRLANRSYSPSSLQHFAACPYRFALQAVFQFRPREEAARLEQMDPLTRGALFHSSQFELFRVLTSANLLPVTPGRLPQALDLADQVLDRVAAQYEDDLAPAIPRVWKSEIENLRTDLRGWLQQVAATQSEWLPVHFEFAFGLAPHPDRDPASTRREAVILDGLRLRGSIDLIERHSGNNTLRVTDHKTGKAPKDRPQYVGGGATLQPLLYAHAAETLLGQSVESGRLYFCTQRGDFSAIDIPLNDESRARLRRVLGTIDRSMEEGFLPAAPQPGACALCDYSAVCGPYEETRVRRKPSDLLEPLIEIRHSP